MQDFPEVEIDGVRYVPATDYVATTPVGERFPLQPIVVGEHGVHRFRANKMVQALLEDSALDLNDLCVMAHGEAEEDYAQLMVLIGYSVSGFCGLSSTPEDLADAADKASDALAERAK